MSWVGMILLAYLIGSIPAAYLAGRMVKGRDIWSEGDGNPGAGNVYRSIGPKAGLLVGAVDVGKGAVVVLLARAILGGNGIEMAAGAAAVTGHSWSIFMKFRGGRGAASTAGVFCALIPIPAVPVALICLALLPLVRSATLILGILMVPMPLLAWTMEASSSVVLFTIALPVGVGLRHYLTVRGGEIQPQLPDQEPQAQDKMLPQG